MSKMKVQFQTPDDVLDFIKKVERIPVDMDMAKGASCVVDAKSILGIISLGLGNILDLYVYSEDSSHILRAIHPYVVAAE